MVDHDDVDSTGAQRADRLDVRRAAVERHDHLRAVGDQRLGFVELEAITGLAASHARDRARAGRAQPGCEHGGRRDAVDVVVAEETDRLAALHRRAETRDGLRHPRHRVRRPQRGELRIEERTRLDLIAESPRHQHARRERVDAQRAREIQRRVRISLANFQAHTRGLLRGNRSTIHT